MTYIDDILEEVRRVTPKYGYNVCLFDDYEPVGEKLELLEHFDTLDKAEEFAQEVDGEVYIYAGTNESEEADIGYKNHYIDKYLQIAEDDYDKGKTSDNDQYEKTNYGGESYGIQNMLDDIVSKSLGKEDKEKIEEQLKSDFSLDGLLNLVADKLAQKAGKKLGLESTGLTRDWDKDEKRPILMGYQLNDEDIDEETGFYKNPNDGEPWQYGGEGGKGSGRKGHQKWMLEGEAMDECPNCMIQTDKDENGKCILCKQ